MSTGAIYKKNIMIDYGFTFTKSINMTSGFWLIYLASKGLSLAWIGIMEGIFHVTSMLMETPTGVVADLFGRKTSRLLGIVSYLIHIGLLLMGTQIWHYIIAFIFCALAYNLDSGAAEALVYDSLKVNGEEGTYAKVAGVKEVLFQAASGLGVVIGGYLAVVNYDLPYYVTAAVTSVALMIGLSFKEVPVPNQIKHPSIMKAIKHQYVSSFDFVKKQPRMLYLTLILNIVSTFVLIGFFYAQNYWQGMGVLESYIGIMLAVHALFSALGGFFAHKIEARLGEKKLIVISYVLVTLLYYLLFFKWTSFVAIMLIGFIDSLMFVVMNSYMNHMIPSEQRATLLSFSSMVFSIIMIIFFPVVGFVGDILGLANTFLILAVILTVITILVSKNVVFQKKKENGIV